MKHIVNIYKIKEKYQIAVDDKKIAENKTLFDVAIEKMKEEGFNKFRKEFNNDIISVSFTAGGE